MHYNFYMNIKFNKFIIALAPMAGVTDFAFRKICSDFGADIGSNSLLWPFPNF